MTECTERSERREGRAGMPLGTSPSDRCGGMLTEEIQ
jgi:hypothetical protein